MREADLSPLVTNWLTSLGCSVYAEVDAGIGGPIDHIGVKWDTLEIVCVEMKTSCTKKLIWQAALRQLITESVYIAVGTKPRKSSIELAQHYGLGVFAGSVIVEPSEHLRNVWASWRDKCLEACRRSGEGGIGGLPTMKGEGPAIRVAAAVREFRRRNPGASWREIFASVPNHYSHVASMSGAVRGK